MKRISRIISLIVCFQLTWGCGQNSWLSSNGSSGPAEGFTELSGTVSLALNKVTETLIPSAMAQDTELKSVDAAQKISVTFPYCIESKSDPAAEPVIELNKVDSFDAVSKSADTAVASHFQKKQVSVPVANLIDYSDLNNPCIIKEIELKLTADEKITSYSYSVEIESSLIENKVVAVVVGNEGDDSYGRAMFTIEKGERTIKQNLNTETSMKADILVTQLVKEYAGAEMNDEKKSEIKNRIKELKAFEDFGFDLCGGKEEIFNLMKNHPLLKLNIMEQLIFLRNAKAEEDQDKIDASVELIRQMKEDAAAEDEASTDESILDKSTPDSDLANFK